MPPFASLLRLALALAGLWACRYGHEPQTRQVLNLQMPSGFYSKADRMMTGWWRLPGTLRNGVMVDIWETGQGRVRRRDSLVHAYSHAGNNTMKKPTNQPRYFAARQLRGISLQWSGLQTDSSEAQRYLWYVCHKWNSSKKNKKRQLPTDLMSVSLEAVVSLGYPDPEAENRGWLGGGWVQPVENHLVLLAKRQCIPVAFQPAGPIEVKSPLADPVVANGMQKIHTRRTIIEKERLRRR